MRKEKISYSMQLEPSIYNRLTKEAKKLNVSKVKIVSVALTNLFKSDKLEVHID